MLQVLYLMSEVENSPILVFNVVETFGPFRDVDYPWLRAVWPEFEVANQFFGIILNLDQAKSLNYQSRRVRGQHFQISASCRHGAQASLIIINVSKRMGSVVQDKNKFVKYEWFSFC